MIAQQTDRDTTLTACWLCSYLGPAPGLSALAGYCMLWCAFISLSMRPALRQAYERLSKQGAKDCVLGLL